MELVSAPEGLDCSECRDPIDDTGYLPAIRRGDAYEPLPNAAICVSCGFEEVGMLGCAPTLDDLDAPAETDVLLYVDMTDAGVDVVSAKE